MKKIYITEKFKRYQKIKYKKRFKRIARTQKDIAKIKENNIIHHKQTIKSNRRHTIKTPTIFSFIRNHDEFIAFLNNLKISINRYNRIRIDSSGIKELTPDALTAMLACISTNINNINTKIEGTYPTNAELNLLWKKSGFSELVKNNKTNAQIKNDGVIMRNDNKADGETANKIINFATSSLIGKEKKCKGVYSTFMELMGNTHEHASKDEGAERWWASVYCDKNTNIAHYSFIDYGCGVFESVKLKNLQKFQRLYKGNSEIFQELIKGKINISQTGDIYRCNGLNTIYKHNNRSNIKKLVFITNDVYADIANNRFEKMKNKFNGTFCYWEYDNECN